MRTTTSQENQTIDQLSFVFNNHIFCGTIGNFWHFNLGYLLPLSAYLLENPLKNKSYLLQNCGPVMNSVLCSFELTSKESIRFSDNLISQKKNSIKRMETYLPWMKFVFDKLKPRAFRQSHIESIKKDNKILLPRWDVVIRDCDMIPKQLVNNINLLKNALTSGKLPCTCCDESSIQNDLLILKRAQPHQFYSKGRAINRKGYGAEKRQLVNIENAAAQLVENGVKVKIYEAGAHEINCQINHFSSCKAFVGVRGAEFINMIWMKVGSKVIMYNSSELKGKGQQEKLANALGLKYYEMDGDGIASPTLNTKDILNIL